MNLGIINGPTEGILIGVGMMIISGIFGPQVFHMRITEAMAFLGLPVTLPSFVPEWFSIADASSVFMIGLLFLFQYPLSIYTVYQHKKKEGKSFWSAMIGLPPSLIFFALAYSWLAHPKSVILSESHIILFIITFGFGFARIVSKIILAYVTKGRFPYYSLQLLPLIIGAININSDRLFGREPLFVGEQEVQFVWGALVFNVFCFFFWAYFIIDAFCGHLKIKAFRIPRVKST